MQNPLLNYKQSVENGKIGNDAAQELVILRLQELWQQLEASPPKTNLLQKLLNKKAPPRSIYIWGEVGRGKSMLMDMFFFSTTAQPSSNPMLDGCFPGLALRTC